MRFFQFLLILIYIFFIVYNYRGYIRKSSTLIMTILTVSLATFLLCASNTANYDLSETGLDISGYRYIYEEIDVLDHEDFNMYYIFYSCMSLGQRIGLPFRAWWAIMSVLAMSVVICACKIHHYNLSLFLATFMAYYEFVFYSGFKFFYGFCFLLLSYGFLLRNNRVGQILFAVFTCVAGGFHMMYYFFLILLIKPLKHSKYFVSIVVIATVLLTVLMRLSNSAVSFLTPFFNALDNDHINKYTNVTVRSGFYIAVLIHMLVLYMVIKIKRFYALGRIHSIPVDALFYTVLLSLLFCPFYAVSLTFMRLITAFSLVVISAGSSVLDESFNSRNLCAKFSLLIVAIFILIRIVTGLGSSRGFFEASVVPFFDVF